MTVASFLADSRDLVLRPTRGVAEWRTLIDQAIALIALIALSPVMLVLALSVWASSGAPIFFRHYRVGRNGKLFPCLKFRTMRRDSEVALAKLLASDPQARAEWDRDQKLRKDPRITTIGQFLRKTSLDELPQLINVLRGEMALVGPRPVTRNELARYGVSRWHYMSVLPGVTGLWQVSGRNQLSYEARVALDCEYVEKRSISLDFMILVRTIRVVLTGHGAS